MEKKKLYSIVLHFKTSTPILTEADTKKLIKGLLDTLRIEAKNKGWHYRIWVAYSEENLRSIKKTERHIHILLYFSGNAYGKNGMIDSIKHYWIPPTPKIRRKGEKPEPKRQRWGKVCTREVYDANGLLSYFRAQSGFTMREQKSKNADIFLPIEGISECEITKSLYEEKYLKS